MAVNVANAVQRTPLLSRETPRPAMAKATLPILTIREKRAVYGAILRRACVLAGYQTRKEAADALDVDEGQLGRWWSGDENPQTWRFQSHHALGPSLLVAQAEAHQGGDAIVVETVVRVMRRA